MTSFSRLLIVVLLALTATGCGSNDANQEAVDMLSDGVWETSSFTQNGEAAFAAVEVISEDIVHAECENDDADCTIVSTYVHPDGDSSITTITSHTYRIHDEGTKLTTTETSISVDGNETRCTSDCEFTQEIVELTDNRLVTSFTDAGGNVWEKTLSKKS